MSSHCLHHPSTFHHGAENTWPLRTERDIYRENEARWMKQQEEEAAEEIILHL